MAEPQELLGANPPECREQGGSGKSKSVVGKMKDRARKLTSKVKKMSLMGHDNQEEESISSSSSDDEGKGRHSLSPLDHEITSSCIGYGAPVSERNCVSITQSAPDTEALASGNIHVPCNNAVTTFTCSVDDKAGRLEELASTRGQHVETVSSKTEAVDPKSKGCVDEGEEKITGLTDSVLGQLQTGTREDEEQHPTTQVSESDHDQIQTPPSRKTASTVTDDQRQASAPDQTSSTITDRAAASAKDSKDPIASKLTYSDAVSPQESTASTITTEEAGAMDEIGSNPKNVRAQSPSEKDDNCKKEAADHHEERRAAAVSTAELFSPGEEDKALSELITDTLSSSTATVRDKIMAYFSSKRAAASSSPSLTVEEDQGSQAGGSDSSPSSHKSGFGIAADMMSSVLGKEPEKGSSSPKHGFHSDCTSLQEQEPA